MAAAMQQFVDAAVRPGGVFPTCLYPSGRIKAIELGGTEQGLNDRSTLADAFGHREQPVLFTQGNRPNAVFVVVEFLKKKACKLSYQW